MSDRAYMLEKGQIRWQGTMAEFATDVDRPAPPAVGVVMASRPRSAAKSEYRLDDQVDSLLCVSRCSGTRLMSVLSRIVKGLTQTQFAALAKLREVGPCSFFFFFFFFFFLDAEHGRFR